MSNRALDALHAASAYFRKELEQIDAVSATRPRASAARAVLSRAGTSRLRERCVLVRTAPAHPRA